MKINIPYAVPISSVLAMKVTRRRAAEKPVHNWNINLTHEFARSVDDLRRGKQPRPIDCLPPKIASKADSKPTAQSCQIPKQD